MKVGPRYAELWVITDGLKAGERVVVEGLQKVRPGVKVVRSRTCQSTRRRRLRPRPGSAGSDAMAQFFINRPIVAMVIAIIMTMVGLVSMLSLPIAQFPEIAPPEIQLAATYIGADALTVEQSVATPIEQQMSGVRQHELHVLDQRQQRRHARCTSNFDVNTDPNIDQMLTQMRYTQAESQLPQRGAQLRASRSRSRTTSPLTLFCALLAQRAPTTPSSWPTTPTSTSTTR